MPFLKKLSVFAAASLLLRAVSAQTCYYPDGLTPSDDIPCNSNAQVSSCCPTGSFCMDNGLCFGGSVVSRASCTDQAWSSAECPRYCTDVNESSAIGLTACDTDSKTFACGLNTTQCQTAHSTFTMTDGTALVLRPAQIAALTANYTNPSSSSAHHYGPGSMIGVALGVGLPLAFALVMVVMVLRKERQQYLLQSIFEQRLEPMGTSDSYRRRSFSNLSKSGTMTTFDSASTSTYTLQQPQQPPSAFLHKYDSHEKFYDHEREFGAPVFELPGNAPEKSDRFEAP
ncbi:hypothetical protein E4T47_01390 [Aureobasidium subglaciale]|nr:hypothetical protein E4T47_01390 [Aureobasidium subglaciale]